MTDGPHATEGERALGRTEPGGGERAGDGNSGPGRRKWRAKACWAERVRGKRKPFHFF